MPSHDEIYRQAFADALAQNLAGDQLDKLSPEESETAVAYAKEYAEGEVEAARALAAADRFVATPGDFRKLGPDEKVAPVPPGAPGREIRAGRARLQVCGLCAALTTRDGQRTHARYHAAFDRPADEQGAGQ